MSILLHLIFCSVLLISQQSWKEQTSWSNCEEKTRTRRKSNVSKKIWKNYTMHWCTKMQYGMHVCMPTHTHIIIIIIIVNPLTARVTGAPQMILQPVFSIFFLFSTALWDLPNSRPVHSLMLSSHLFLCPPCLLPPFTVPCKMVLARPDERETWPYYCSLRLFTIVRKPSYGPIACWILARISSLVAWSL